MLFRRRGAQGRFLNGSRPSVHTVSTRGGTYPITSSAVFVSWTRSPCARALRGQVSQPGGEAEPGLGAADDQAQRL